MTDEAELRKLAEAATPGPWHVANKTVALLQDDFFQVNSLARWVCLVEDGTPFSKQDAAFIAAANPMAIIALLDELTALRAKVKAQDKALNGALERLAQISAGQINQTYTSPAALLAWAQEIAFMGLKEGRAAEAYQEQGE